MHADFTMECVQRDGRQVMVRPKESRRYRSSPYRLARRGFIFFVSVRYGTQTILGHCEPYDHELKFGRKLIERKNVCRRRLLYGYLVHRVRGGKPHGFAYLPHLVGGSFCSVCRSLLHQVLSSPRFLCSCLYCCNRKSGQWKSHLAVP